LPPSQNFLPFSFDLIIVASRGLFELPTDHWTTHNWTASLRPFAALGTFIDCFRDLQIVVNLAAWLQLGCNLAARHLGKFELVGNWQKLSFTEDSF
jgi:hypothetical protein